MSLTQLSVADPDSVREALDQLRSSESSVNWVLFGYQSRDTLELLNAGDGGLDDLKTNLEEDSIRFGLLECVVTGDHYNSVKFVLITWIGPKVPAGLAKAKAAGHRKELVNFLTESLAVAAEFQAQNINDIDSRDISAALTKRAATYQDSISVGDTKDKRQVMSRSHAASGDRKKSQLNIVDEDKIAQALKDVYEGKQEWVQITYVPGKKDEVFLKNSGKGGLDAVKGVLEDGKVCVMMKLLLFSCFVDFASDFFLCCYFSSTETTTTTTKYVLLTWVPESTPPLQKARSGAHRSELADWIITILPFHSHYQANSMDDLTENGVMFKLRS